MLFASESEIPAALPKSRCPPSITPPSNWVTPVSKQFRAPANQQDPSPSLEITGQLEHYRLQGTNPHEAQSYLQAILQTENHQMQYRQFQQMYGNSMFVLWSNLDQQTMNAYFLRRAGALPSVLNVGALPSVSNVAISGSADQTKSLRPSGSLTDRVERVRPLDSQSEEGSVRQRVRPLVDTLGGENAHIGTYQIDSSAP